MISKPASDALTEKNSQTDDLSPAYGDAIIETSIADAVILNPVLSEDATSDGIISLIFSSLLKRNSHRETVGDLADSFEVSDDGKRVVFYLRKDVRWHDGEKFSSKDVRFTYDKIMDPETQSSSRKGFSLISSMETPDDYTVIVNYEKPYAPALTRWLSNIVPEHIYRNEDFNKSTYNRQPIGTGPYRFVDWRPDEQILLEAYDGYFDGKPYIKRYICRIIPDESAAFLALKRGDIDVMAPNVDQYVKHASTPEFLQKFNVYRYPSTSSYTFIGYNQNNKFLADAKVRKALTMAVNRQAIIDDFLHGYGSELTGPFSPADWAYNKNVMPLPFSPETSKKLLAECGFTDTDGDKILEKDNEKFEIKLYTNNGNEIRKLVANVYRDYLAAVGVSVIVETLEWSLFLKQCRSRDFDAILLSWSLGADPDHYGIWHSSEIPEGEEKPGNNYIGFSDSESDRLWEEGRVTFDQEKRKEIYFRLHELIYDLQPYTFLFVKDNIVIVDRRIHGISLAPSGIYYNFDKWFVPKVLHKY